MKKDRSELEKILYGVIEENGQKRRTIKEKIIKKMSENEISSGKTVGIFNKTIPVETLPLQELYLFTNALFDVTENEKINPGYWFNDEEIKSFKIYKPQKEYKNDVVVFYNVDQVSENQYFCSKATYQEMYKIFSQGLITYNIRTQRETTTILFSGRQIEVPTIKQNPIIEMTQKMLDGKFTPNTIALNIRKIGTEQFEYNAKNRTLAIAVDNEESFLDIIDGMHRMQSAIRSVEVRHDINLYTSINILNYTEEEAQEFIEQEDHRTPISKTHIAAFKRSDTEVIISNDIDKFGNSKTNELFKKIATNYNDIELYNRYVTIETFAKSLKHNYKIENPRDISKIEKYLIEFFNELIGQLKDLNKGGVYFTNNIFIGYIALSSFLYQNDNWQNILCKIIEKFDDSYIESNLDIYNTRITKPYIDKISKYFKNLGDESNV